MQQEHSDTNVDESGDTNMKFGFMIPFLTLANMFGKGIGASLWYWWDSVH